MFRAFKYRLAILSLGLGLILTPAVEAQFKGGKGGGGGGGGGGVRIGGGGGGGGGISIPGGGGGGNSGVRLPSGGGGISIPGAGGSGIKIPSGGNVGGNPINSSPINRAPAGINLPGKSLPNPGQGVGNPPKINVPNIGQPNVGQPNIGKSVNQNLNNTINNAIKGGNPLNNAGKNTPNINLGNNNFNNNRPGSQNAFGINTGNAGVNALINQSLGGNVYNRNSLNNPTVRASINQNNYKGWNNYSNYGKYSWYRGPIYNPYGWYGGFYGIGYGFGSNYGYGGPGYGYGFGYGNGYGWGTSNLLYRSGYGAYYNPYYATTYGGYSYAQPILVSSTTVQPSSAVMSDLDQARAAFKSGQYQNALTAIDRAIQAQPNDPVLHEFRALTLFALGNYDQAAGTIHAVLAVGPGWDWATLVGLYSNVDVYTKQLRALEDFTNNNPQSAASRFYLAYLYQTSGQTDAAIKSLKQVVAINPKDTGAAAMLQMLESKGPDATANASPTTEPAPANEPNLNTTAIVGTWHATRDDGRFDVTLNADQTFTWKFTQGQRADEIKGTYSSQGPVLVLATKDQGSMAGKVTLTPGQGDMANEFQFQMVGGNPNDPGLKFVK